MNSGGKKHILQWHILHRCNLKCTHCYQDERGAESNFDQLKELFDQYMEFCREYGFRGHINITGGEPLLSDNLFPLLSLLEENGITFGLLTNGTLIDRTAAERLSRYSRLSFVQVSIDGTRETHDSVRGKGSFDKAIEGLRNIGNVGIQTMAAFTCHKRNYHELMDVIGLVRKNKIDRFWADRLIPIGGSCEDILSNEQFRETLKVLTREHERKWLFSRSEIHLNRSLQFLEGGDCYYHCAAGTTLLTLLADGTLLPCRRLPIPLGNCFENDMLRIYKSSPLIEELSKETIPDDCLNCPKAHLCRGGAKCLTYAVTGGLNAKDINCYFKYQGGNNA
ncbi:MAG: radical SAM protein [Ruminococcus sp.]|nr:radical SAM protein [Ruminococcus sp.]